MRNFYFRQVGHYDSVRIMKKNNKTRLVCDVCGREEARLRKVTESHGKGKDLLVIESIPMISCPHCGESYFTAETLHEIERIKLHRRSFATERPVEVAEFV